MTQLKESFNRGDVVLVVFPSSDLRSAKAQPAVIVQADHLNTGLSQVVVARLTSQMFRAGHPCRVTVLIDSVAGKESGLLLDSVVMADNLVTVKLESINRAIGWLPMEAIDGALRRTLGLEAP
jgi:mRNA interferase MazF